MRHLIDIGFSSFLVHPDGPRFYRLAKVGNRSRNCEDSFEFPCLYSAADAK